MGLHRCTPNELFSDVEDQSSDDTPRSSFFPIHSNSLKDVKLYQKKLWCIDEDVVLQGDYNSDKAKVLKLSFEKCNDATYVPEFRRRDLNGTAVSSSEETLLTNSNLTQNASNESVTEDQEVLQCHSDEEITRWLRRKFIIVLQNQERFQTNVFDDNRVVREAKLKYFPVNTLIR